jgi:hypothetical protein
MVVKLNFAKRRPKVNKKLPDQRSIEKLTGQRSIKVTRSKVNRKVTR